MELFNKVYGRIHYPSKILFKNDASTGLVCDFWWGCYYNDGNYFGSESESRNDKRVTMIIDIVLMKFGIYTDTLMEVYLKI